MAITRFLLLMLLASIPAFLAGPPQSAAQERGAKLPPRILSYQGYLTDVSGASVPDGDYQVTMRLYDTAVGGVPLWEERSMVTTYGGAFDMYLGLDKPIDLPFDRSYWLAAEISGEPEMLPRTLLVAAPYAFHALYAAKAGELAAGAEGAVTGLNGAQGELTIVGEKGVRVIRSGDTIYILGTESGSSMHVSPTESANPPTLTSTIRSFDTEGMTGTIAIALGGEGLATQPPVAGSFQDAGMIRVNNRSVTDRSVIHVSVQEKEDDGVAPGPNDAIWVVDIDDRKEGSFTLRIGFIPTATNPVNFQTSDRIHIGYTIVNALR